MNDDMIGVSKRLDSPAILFFSEGSGYTFFFLHPPPFYAGRET